MLVVVQFDPLTAGKTCVRKEPLCSSLFCVLQRPSIEPLRHIDRCLRLPAVQHGKGFVAQLPESWARRDGRRTPIGKELGAFGKAGGVRWVQVRAVELRCTGDGETGEGQASH